MLEHLDARVAASIDPNFSANRTYLLDNTPQGLQVLVHDSATEEDVVIPLQPASNAATKMPPIWDEKLIEARARYQKERRVLGRLVTAGALLIITAACALLIKGVD